MISTLPVPHMMTPIYCFIDQKSPPIDFGLVLLPWILNPSKNIKRLFRTSCSGSEIRFEKFLNCTLKTLLAECYPTSRIEARNWIRE